jgi:hypothetical protein
MTVFIRGKVKLRTPARGYCVSDISVDLGFGVLTERVVNADSPRHSLFTLNIGKHLCRILERDWSFTQGIADGEKIDESSRRE